nr:hypothetical protein [Tanacetum cinerariifolium]
MGEEHPLRTLGDYSKPSHEGYRNTIELPEGNNVDFLKLVDSLDLNGDNRERTRQRLFQFSLRDQANNWHDCLPAGSITTWEDLTTCFLAYFFPLRRTTKFCNDILMFQQHQRESLSESWTHFKDLLQKVPHHGIDLWLQVQKFYDHVTPVTRQTINQSADGKLRDRNAKESWPLLEDLALYDNERRGFFATANAIIDCRKAKIVVGEGITRSVFEVKGANLGEEEAPNWTTLGKRESYKPRPSSDGVGNFSLKTKRKSSQCVQTASGLNPTASRLQQCEDLKIFKLYLIRRSLKVLRKFHLTTLGGRFNQLSHVSSPLLSKPREY